ncbi:MAG: DUF1697 domain-containing protein [Maricaulaceae bacterium]|nr:DUF1697 domain-containing protein [Maricaulaceae bacterium]
MSVFIALLRGINVGGHRKVPMAELRALLAGLGYAGVKTHVQSGNAVFRAPGAAEEVGAALEAALEARFGFVVETFVFPLAQWRDIVAANPFPENAQDPTKLVVMLTRAPPVAEQLAPLHAARTGDEALQIAAGALFLKLPEGQGQSKLAETTMRVFKGAGTARNWRTMVTLLDMGEALAAE